MCPRSSVGSTQTAADGSSDRQGRVNSVRQSKPPAAVRTASMTEMLRESCRFGQPEVRSCESEYPCDRRDPAGHRESYCEGPQSGVSTPFRQQLQRNTLYWSQSGGRSRQSAGHVNPVGFRLLPGRQATSGADYVSCAAREMTSPATVVVQELSAWHRSERRPARGGTEA